MRFSVRCALPAGLHARPAAELARQADGFAATATLYNRRSGATADLKSVLALLAADVRDGDECDIEIAGADASAAGVALRQCIETELPVLEARLEAAPERPAARLPASLIALGAVAYAGTTVYPGIGQGRLVLLQRLQLPIDAIAAAGATEQDATALHAALERARTKLEQAIAGSTTSTESAILRAHLAILCDPELLRRALQTIATGETAAAAVMSACGSFEQQLKAAQSAYIRERAADVTDVCVRLLQELGVPQCAPPTVTLREPSIVVAESLTPQQLLALDRHWLQALVFESPAMTSHAAILAQSLAVPTVAAVSDASRHLAGAGTAIVDATRGIVVLETDATHDFYERERRVELRRHERLSRRAHQPATTLDGRALSVAANITTAEECQRALAAGADGVGLFRTELLFMARGKLLSEEEQFAEYAAAARTGKPVVIRCLDVGGDKPLATLSLPPEANPFLGYRGVRIYPEHAQLLRTQVRAILRASAFGPVQLLVPMVSAIEEVKWVAAQIERAKQQLRAEGLAFDAAMPFGVMLEVPAACMLIAQLSRHVDFFSIGTNDLAQYCTAADRTNARVAPLASTLHPGLLQLLRQCVQQIHAAGKRVSLCGEMAADVAQLPLIVGLGIDGISCAAAAIPALRERVRNLSMAGCRELLARACDCDGAGEVREALQAMPPVDAPSPLLEAGLVVLDARSQTREDAIQTLSDALYVAGRTDDRDGVERALLAREATYSTALGNGFAVPHCKTGAVRTDSIGVLKPARPLTWGGSDAEPVRMVIMLAMQDAGGSQRHMRVFSRLARRLMDDSFREQLLRIDDADTVVAQLSREFDAAEVFS